MRTHPAHGASPCISSMSEDDRRRVIARRHAEARAKWLVSRTRRVALVALWKRIFG